MQMKDMLKFLFQDSQGSKNPVEDIVAELFEDAEDMEKLEKNSQPLHKALKALGVDRALTSTPSGLRMEFDDESEYNEVRHKVIDPNNLYTLASAGWIATSSDDVEPMDEAPKYVLNFISIGEIETGDDETSAEELEKLIKDAREEGDSKKPEGEPSGGVTRESDKTKRLKNIDERSDALIERLIKGEQIDL
jgi:hypothetical protein